MGQLHAMAGRVESVNTGGSSARELRILVTLAPATRFESRSEPGRSLVRARECVALRLREAMTDLTPRGAGQPVERRVPRAAVHIAIYARRARCAATLHGWVSVRV